MLYVLQLIVSEVRDRLDSLVTDKWGRHVIHYLMKARDPQHVNKEIRELLSLGDGNTFSKKDTAVRQNELRDEVTPTLTSYS